MNYVNSNLSPLECVRLIPAEVTNQLNIETWAECAEALPDIVSSVECYMSEASGCYPAEDFLQDIIDRLDELSKTVRGNNKAELKSISIALESLQLSTHRASEHGKTELYHAQKELDKSPL